MLSMLVILSTRRINVMFFRTLLFTDINFTDFIFTDIIIHAKASSVQVMSVIIMSDNVRLYLCTMLCQTIILEKKVAKEGKIPDTQKECKK